MERIRNAIYSIEKSDRILLALFIPLIVPILAWLTWYVHQIKTTKIESKIFVWVIADFFFASTVFALLLWIWAIFRPKVIGNLLVSSTKKVKRCIFSFYFIATAVYIMFSIF